MEYRDLFDKDRKFTGEKIAKDLPLPPNRYITVVIAVIENSDGELLLQKRSLKKGGLWAFTGGHPKSGQTSLQGICEELQEEIGVSVDEKELILFKTIQGPRTFTDLYYVKKDIELEDLKLQTEEVADAKWFDKERVERMILNRQFFDRHVTAFLAFKDWRNKDLEK